MNILALDTATEIVSAGVSTERGEFHIEADAGTTHSELLFDMIDAVLRVARLEREEIALFACMKGPGSWTGLRIGFSAVQGFAFALQKPFIAVPTLDCAALPYAGFDGLVLPVLDAKQGKFFCAAYKNGSRLSDYLDAPLETIAGLAQQEKHILLAGNAAEMLLPELRRLCPHNNIAVDAHFRTGRALNIIRYIKNKPPLAESGGTESSALLYLRKSDAEIKRELV